jgi:hypothetical protein
MYIAGAPSSLLGIGSGAAKVLAMDKIMSVPLKVSTTTSNFLIGVTAVALEMLFNGVTGRIWMIRGCPNRNDVDIERVPGTLLVVGVCAAAVVILSGGLLHVIRTGASKEDFAVFRGSQTGFRAVTGLRTVPEIAGWVFQLQSDGLVMLGVLIWCSLFS